MKTIKIILTILATISLLINLGCKKNKVIEPSNSDYLLIRNVGFYLKDSINNQNLIGRFGQRYHPDSIRVFTLSNNQIDKSGRVVLDSLNNYYGGILYFYQLVSKSDEINIFSIDIPVYIYLNYTDTDTIQIKKLPFQDFTFYINNRVASTAPALSNVTPLLTIKK